MGWDGYHLHRFIKGNTYYLPPKDRADDCFFEGVPKQFDSGMLSLGELLSRKGSKIKYEYDFGDSWIHEIILESCQSYKKVPYLQDAEVLKQVNTQVSPVQDARLIPGDEVSILVSTSDPVVSQPFNAQGSTFLLDDREISIIRF